MCSKTCQYEHPKSYTKLFSVMKTMTRCVNGQDEFDFDTVTICPVHYQVHICRGGDTCSMAEEGTCCYTNRSFDGRATTRALTMEGTQDYSSNANALSHGGKTRKSTPVANTMDLDSFIEKVHHGLSYVSEEEDATSEEEPLTPYLATLCAKIHGVMTYNNTITKSATACSTWVQSTIQVLRAAQGKRLVPNMTSAPTVKAIVVETVNTMVPPKQLWWAKRPYITRQWWA